MSGNQRFRALSHLNPSHRVLSNINQGAACVTEQCPPGDIAAATNPSPQFHKTHQVFGLWNDLTRPEVGGDLFLNQATPDLERGETMITAFSQSPLWWQIDLWGKEVRRFIGAPGTLPPLTKGQINNDGVCNTTLKARIEFETTTARVLDVDIGPGTHFSILASSVSVYLLQPKGYRSIQGPLGSQTAKGPGLITDTIVSASAYSSVSIQGEHTATFTQYVAQNNGDAQIDIPVPCGAKFVSIFRSPSTGNPAALEWLQAEDLFPQANAITSLANVFGVFERPVPQISDTLRVPVNNTGEILGYTIQWHLEF